MTFGPVWRRLSCPFLEKAQETEGNPMTTRSRQDKIIVGVDGSDASIEALRQAHHLASALGTGVEGWICWDFPVGHEAYEMMGTDGFSRQASEILRDAMTRAFGAELPANVRSRLVLGAARQSLIDASRFASFLVVGRRGHGGFNGLLLGSVSAACVAHAHCPVLVVHAPEAKEHADPRSGATGASTQKATTHQRSTI
jgi:nucleotide-binding universal stress UspA family protein